MQTRWGAEDDEIDFRIRKHLGVGGLPLGPVLVGQLAAGRFTGLRDGDDGGIVDPFEGAGMHLANDPGANDPHLVCI